MEARLKMELAASIYVTSPTWLLPRRRERLILHETGRDGKPNAVRNISGKIVEGCIPAAGEDDPARTG